MCLKHREHKVSTGGLCRAQANGGTIVSTMVSGGAEAEVRDSKGATTLLRATHGAVGGAHGT